MTATSPPISEKQCRDPRARSFLWGTWQANRVARLHARVEAVVPFAKNE